VSGEDWCQPKRNPSIAPVSALVFVVVAKNTTPPRLEMTNDLQHRENQMRSRLKKESLHLLTFRPEVEGI
jgi:hypothetical protein